MSIAIGMGTDVKFGGVSFSCVKDIQGFDANRDAVDMTCMSSSNNIREVGPGLVDAGSVEITLLLDNATTTAEDYITAAANTLLVTFPYNTGQSTTKPSFSWSAFCTDAEMTFEIDTPSELKLTYKLTGTPTIVLGS